MSNEFEPRMSNEFSGGHRMSNQPRLDSMNSGLFSARMNDPSVNEMRNNYMQVADYSPDFKGRWLTESPTGNKFLSYMVNQAQKAGFASPESVDYMQNAIGGGGIPLWGGYVSPILEGDRWGFNWNIGLGG